MKKWKVLLGTVALSLGLLFAVGNSSCVSATTWHHQTPRVLRGKWQSKSGHFYIITKHIIEDGQIQSDVYPWKVSLSTRHGHSYYLHGHMKMDRVYHSVYRFRRTSKHTIIGYLWGGHRATFYKVGHIHQAGI